MSKEGRLPFEPKNDKLVAEALAKDSYEFLRVIGAETIKTDRASLRFEENTDIAENDEEIIAQFERGSITNLIYDVIGNKYPQLKLSIEKRSGENKSSRGRSFGIHLNIPRGEKILERIFTHPVIGVLEMDFPEINRKDGIKLEEEGILTQGTTDRSYMRYLQHQISGLVKTKSKKPMPLKILLKLDQYKERFFELLKIGLWPIQDEEAAKLIEQAIDEVLAKLPQ